MGHVPTHQLHVLDVREYSITCAGPEYLPEPIRALFLAAEPVVSELKSVLGHASCTGWSAEDGFTAIDCGCGTPLYRAPIPRGPR